MKRVFSLILITVIFFIEDAQPAIGQLTFTDVTPQSGVPGAAFTAGTAWGDYDNDGDQDLALANRESILATTHLGTMNLYRNNNDGTFTDVTAEAGLTAMFRWGHILWADYDNDGDIDLFVTGENDPDFLYRNNGNGTFTEVSQTAGLLNPTGGQGASWADYNNDGHIDIFVTGGGGPSLLYRNNGDGTFDEVSSETGAVSSGNTRSASWSDHHLLAVG